MSRISHEQWQQLRDTGVGDAFEHATSVITEEYGFDLVLEHSFTRELLGPCIFRLFLHPAGVLAQIDDNGRGSVHDLHAWGCARMRDHVLFCAAGASHGPMRDGVSTWVELGPGMPFGLAWLISSAAVNWLSPWPRAIVPWLGPAEPGPKHNGPDPEQARRNGGANTAEILEQLPEHVHTMLGPIAWT